MPVEKSPEQLELDALVKATAESLKACQKHADENGLSFDFAIAEGSLGATYYGKTAVGPLSELFDVEPEDALKYYSRLYRGWQSSYFEY